MSQRRRIVNRRQFISSGAAAVAASLVAQGLVRPASAQDATPEASPEGGGGMPPIPEGAVVVAKGLWNPADLAFGPDGTLYICETGVSGGDDSGPGPAEATPDPAATPVIGPAPLVPPQVSKVTTDGKQAVLSTEAGGVGIGVYNGSVYTANGGGSVGSGMIPHPEENTVHAIDIATGSSRFIADLGAYEVANNPDGTDVNPNLYGLAITADGQIYVADAGGNTIYKVDAANGDFSLFAVVPNLTELTGATPTAEEQAEQPGPRQPVPTSIVIDASGNLIVTLLSESWSGPSIITFAPDASYTASSKGLSMIVDSAMGPDGMLYVSQLTADFSGEQPAPGAVFRIGADGAPEPVASGLFFPHGITFDAKGNLYVSTNSIISGPDAPLGMVLRIDGVAASA